MITQDVIEKLFAELKPILSPQVLKQVSKLSNLLIQGNNIICHGVGREGLVMRALTMRLYHLGFNAHVLGDMTSPPVSAGDVFFVSAGPGYFSTVHALVKIAKKNKAKTISITAEPEGKIPKMVDFIVSIPAQTMASDTANSSRSILPMGSLFEVVMFLFFGGGVTKRGRKMIGGSGGE